MPCFTFYRVLRDHNGDAVKALEHLAQSFEEVCSFVSVGMMRAGQPANWTPKQPLNAIDIPEQDSSPHG